MCINNPKIERKVFLFSELFWFNIQWLSEYTLKETNTFISFVIFFHLFTSVVSIVLKEEFYKDCMFLVHWQGWKPSVRILYKGRESKYFWTNVPLLKCKIYWTTLLIFFPILLYYTNNEILTAKKNIGITRLIKFLIRLRKLRWPQCEDSKLRIWVEVEIIKEGEVLHWKKVLLLSCLMFLLEAHHDIVFLSFLCVYKCMCLFFHDNFSFVL